MAGPEDLVGALARARSDPGPEQMAKLASRDKLTVRRRLDLLLDTGSFVEDGLLAHSVEPGFPADGVVTGHGTVDGRPVCVVANDPTVKAGSWGPLTVEKMVRLTEYLTVI